MIPTSDILRRISKNSTDHKDGVYTRLYRYLLREDVYYTAYKNLYANKGASTRGTDNDTADGFGKEYIAKIIDDLKTLDYKPKAVRRHCIKNQNSNKVRPLGIPSFRDKLVQEVARMFLEAIYEPVFSDKSHGFRPRRSCHSALKQVTYDFTGIKWFIEGDIRGCFDNIDHKILLGLLGERIKDSKFVNLIGRFLKAGYVDNWVYHNTYSGTPQGGIISPILANIYLNELDKEMEKLKEEFDKPVLRKTTKVYKSMDWEIQKTRKAIGKTNDRAEKVRLIDKIKELRKELLRIPFKDTTDKKLVYVRYADDFIIDVNGNRQDCEYLKAHLKGFLANKYKLDLSEEKTKITHSSEYARFLGYDVRVRRNQQIKRRSDGIKQRVLNGTVELCIPFQEKIEKFVIESSTAKYGKDGKFKSCHRKWLNNKTDLEILNIYNAQTRGKCNYYRMASNFNKLNYFVYLMEYSCLKTLARKHKSSLAKIRKKYSVGKNWGVPYVTKSGKKTAMIVTFSELRKKDVYTPTVDVIENNFTYNNKKNEIYERLSTRKCELCGKEHIDLVVHHVRSLKKLTGKEKWEQLMKDKRRKTLMVCKECHANIHHEKC